MNIFEELKKADELVSTEQLKVDNLRHNLSLAEDSLREAKLELSRLENDVDCYSNLD